METKRKLRKRIKELEDSIMGYADAFRDSFIKRRELEEEIIRLKLNKEGLNE